MTATSLKDQAQRLTVTLARLMRHLASTDPDDPLGRLTAPQLRVCVLLHDGPLPMSAMARELGTTLSAVTQIADRLQRAGLVVRMPQQDDRRVKLLQLTTEAGALMGARRQTRIARALDALAHLSPEDREDLLALLQLLDEATSPPTPAPNGCTESDCSGSAELAAGTEAELIGSRL